MLIVISFYALFTWVMKIVQSCGCVGLSGQSSPQSKQIESHWSKQNTMNTMISYLVIYAINFDQKCVHTLAHMCVHLLPHDG